LKVKKGGGPEKFQEKNEKGEGKNLTFPGKVVQPLQDKEKE